MLPLNLYARVRVFCAQIARETAGAASTRSSLRPQTFWRDKAEMQTSGDQRREIADAYSAVIAREGA
jgi:hypothetical protein